MEVRHVRKIVAGDQVKRSILSISGCGQRSGGGDGRQSATEAWQRPSTATKSLTLPLKEGLATHLMASFGDDPGVDGTVVFSSAYDVD